MVFRLTQGTFSFLPDLSDDEIAAQIAYAIANGWAISLEYTSDPHPKNFLWEMWNLPWFDQTDADVVLKEVRSCRVAHKNEYIRLNAYDARYGRQTTALSFIIHRPAQELGFRLTRQHGSDRVVRYRIASRQADETLNNDL
jgi:ribulose-bisphosphate carboxylase small chain